MLQNFIFLLAVLISLVFIGLIWLRQNLLHALSSLIQHESILRKDMQKRRDILPLVLEGLRESEEPTDTWRKIVQERALFHGKTSLTQELEFDKSLVDFLAQTNSKSLRFLEGKKDIEDLGILMEREKATLKALATDYNEKRKKFPYSLASGIFSLRDIAVL